MDRIITLIDMDCFYCQVEVKQNPSWEGKPLAVAQYSESKGKPSGMLLSINYEAKEKGVTRRFSVDAAKKVCPELEIAGVAQVRGKADLTKYRNASEEVFNVLTEFCSHIEKASVDEAYLDLTEIVSNIIDQNTTGDIITENQLPNTYVIGYEKENGESTGIGDFLNEVYHSELPDNILICLATAAVFVQRIRSAIYEKTGYHCSAGIAHNKMLAKIVCGLHKPKCQTILPHVGIPTLYKTLPVKKVRNLGGQFGDIVMETLGCSVMADLEKYSLKDFQKKFPDKTAQWLYNISRGIDLQPVKCRMIANSIGCSKKFPGKSALSTKNDVQHWLSELADELKNRIDADAAANKRRGTLLIMKFQCDQTGISRSIQLPSYDIEKIIELGWKLLITSNKVPEDSDLWSPPLIFLGLCVNKFVTICDAGSSIRNFLKPIEQQNYNENSCSSSCEVSFKLLDEELAATKSDNKNSNFDMSKSFFLQYFLDKHNQVIKDDAEVQCSSNNSNNNCIVNNIDSVININNADDNNVTTNDINISLGKEEYEICADCNQRIRLSEFCEHIDHHVAINLHKELNSNANFRPSINLKNKNITTGDTKRKRNNKKSNQSPAKKCKSILSFFTSK